MITDEHKRNILAAAALLRRAESLTRGAHSLLDKVAWDTDSWELKDAAEQVKNTFLGLEEAGEHIDRAKQEFGV